MSGGNLERSLGQSMAHRGASIAEFSLGAVWGSSTDIVAANSCLVDLRSKADRADFAGADAAL